MKFSKLLVALLGCCCIIACASQKNATQKTPQTITTAFTKKQVLTEEEKKNWQHKDIITDSIFGVNTDLAYNFTRNKKSKNVIVAVIDLEINTNHKDLHNRIWINPDEIPNNELDDDNNGYIDDINGWNFLGTTEKDSVLYQNSESIRIVKKYKKVFQEKSINDIDTNQFEKFQLYKRAAKDVENNITQAHENLTYFKGFKSRYLKLIDTMYVLFGTKEYNFKKLDSLDKISTDSIVKVKIGSMKYCLKMDIDEKWLNRVIKLHKNRKLKIYNVSHHDRLTKDNPYDINDLVYGNNNVRGTRKMSHGTKVAGVIAAIRNNDYGVNGIAENAKIMPIVVSTNGNEYDKDIALAIRYAVDNGAKVINLSIGKSFSLNEDWITEAIQYAESKDALIISSSGNESLDLDHIKSFYYPNDMNKNKIEISNNFIVVGSSNYTKGLISDYSNYGQNTVDVFAPGENIKVITRKGIGEDSGTSISCAVVSGIASMVRSYYPNLTAKEVKEIILNSGVSIDLNVFKPFPEGQERDPNKVPFSSLSKSGKIVNAYNALLMAEEVSKKKKRK